MKHKIILFLFFTLITVATANDEIFIEQEAPSYYDVLGVNQNSSDKDIRKNYLLLVRHFHPDKNDDPAVSSIIKDITQAYDTLGDPEKRREYDKEVYATKPSLLTLLSECIVALNPSHFFVFCRG